VKVLHVGVWDPKKCTMAYNSVHIMSSSPALPAIHYTEGADHYSKQTGKAAESHSDTGHIK